jgi:hypothetical protein
MPSRMPGQALVPACKVFSALFTSVSRIRCLLPLPVLVATAWAEGVALARLHLFEAKRYGVTVTRSS